MKVLEKGPGWSIKQECTGIGNGGAGCGSLLLVEADDIYMTESYDYGGGHDIYYTFTCPICGRETDIKSGSLPSAIKDKVLKKRRGY